jgi:hypothetical protein
MQISTNKVAIPSVLGHLVSALEILDGQREDVLAARVSDIVEQLKAKIASEPA